MWIFSVPGPSFLVVMKISNGIRNSGLQGTHVEDCLPVPGPPVPEVPQGVRGRDHARDRAHDPLAVPRMIKTCSS